MSGNRKYNFTLRGYTGMNYYCIVKSFTEAYAKAKRQAQKLKDEEGLTRIPDVLSIELDDGDYVP